MSSNIKGGDLFQRSNMFLLFFLIILGGLEMGNKKFEQQIKG
jgi:hypothetical protein